ncbi:Hypothetical predicted protein [Octopus vulgaris]|uniref:Uncharacterized protein n=1 Tax=Octopus vulgaris TaxID=6645 RepID=A0AA36EXH0_OCTVU|nr:Hypothetical predicted protein [Octopus vulgaris]
MPSGELPMAVAGVVNVGNSGDGGGIAGSVPLSTAAATGSTGAYIATPRVDVDINCGKENIQRYDLIHLIFQELKKIAVIDTLKMGESGYMCFIVNLSQDMKKNSPESLKANRRLGINRELVKNYCCKLYKNESYVYHSKSICSGNIMENSMFLNYANIVGAIVWIFFPLIIIKYGCHADDNNSNQFSYCFNHSYYHTDITKHRSEGTRQ